MVNRITTGINQYTQQESIKDAQALQKALTLQGKQPSLMQILSGDDASASVDVSTDSQQLLANLDLAKALAPQVPSTEADDVERQNRVSELKSMMASGDISAYLDSIGGSKAIAESMLSHPLSPTTK